jgi:hypothetical protein
MATFSANGSSGVMELSNVDSSGAIALDDVNVEECEITFAMNWISGGAGTAEAGLYYRAASDLSTGYRVVFDIDLDLLTQDTITGVTIEKDGVILGSASLSLVKPFGTPVQVKVRSSNNQAVRAWLEGSPEPTTWDLVTGSGSLESGTIGLLGTVALDASTPVPLSDVQWLWGAEQAITGVGTTQLTGIPVLVGSTTTNLSISAAGQGRDGIGYAARFQLAGTTGSVVANTASFMTAIIVSYTTRFSVRFNTALPTGGDANGLVRLFTCDASAGNDYAVVFRVSDARICFQVSTASATVVQGPVATTNTWYSIEVVADMSLTTNTFRWSVNDVSQTDASTASTAGRSITNNHYGPISGNTTCDMYFDDMIMVSGTGQYPMGDIKIVRLMPVATITEGDTANVWCRFQTNGSSLDVTFNAANILAALTEFPPENAPGAASNGVYQRTVGVSIGHITIPIDNYTLTTGQGVGAVRIEVLFWQASAAGSAFLGLVNVGGADTTMWNQGALAFGNTTQQWGTYIYTPSGGWDITKLNALNIVFDGGGDINPLPGYRFAMTEVAIRTASDAGSSTFSLLFDDLEVCALENTS